MLDSFDTLDDMTRAALVDLLLRLADDELIIGHQGSDWTRDTPLLETDTTFATIARDEIAHATVYYSLLHDLGQPDPESLVYGRQPRAFRCASLVSLPVRNWAAGLLRQFFYDTSEHLRLTRLCDSALTPLARVARTLHTEEETHLHHGRSCVLRLAESDEDNRRQMQEAVHALYPHALGLFEPTEADSVLGHSGITEPEGQFRREWESAVAGVLAVAGLTVNEAAQPIHGGRVGRHPKALADLLESIRCAHSNNPIANR
jgi:ring-1,2-phenylacetyl-CoA epoxidase subunit PaaC